jgi:hypothetical protein
MQIDMAATIEKTSDATVRWRLSFCCLALSSRFICSISTAVAKLCSSCRALALFPATITTKVGQQVTVAMAVTFKWSRTV